MIRATQAGRRHLGTWLALLVALLAASLWPAGAARAHELSMAELVMHETAKGRFVWQWTAGVRAGSDDLVPLWPEGCSTTQGNELLCSGNGLAGTLGMEGVGDRFSAAIVKVHWLDGGLRAYTLSGGQPTVQLYGSAEDKRSTSQIAAAYSRLGVEHILGGFDHLLFVIALMFLVGFNRQLVWTITAFTAAHSITLGLSALGWLALRPPPVEASIALSILLVAGEALRRGDTLSRRWPALVAFLFGLLHGLGFAGALKEIGLPENDLLVALLTFNLGVEAGQLLTVAAAWLVFQGLRRVPQLAPARVAALYAIGALAAYWSIDRIGAILA